MHAGSGGAMMKPRRLLIVDDDQQVRRYLTLVLRDAGYRTVSCAHFEHARRLLTTSPPDLLLADVRLGAYNGLQLAIEARKLHPSIPIIVMTGFDDSALREEAAHSGATFLVKPVPNQELLDCIAKALQ
jgi:DNA-binding NtrC family response regulator